MKGALQVIITALMDGNGEDESADQYFVELKDFEFPKLKGGDRFQHSPVLSSESEEESKS